MIWQLDLLLFGILLATALAAVILRDLLATIAVLAAFSLFVALLFAGLGAVDVAFVEVVLGSAFVGLLFLVALAVTGRSGHRVTRHGRLTALPLVGAFVALMVFATVDLPDRGDPDAPAHIHVAPDYLERSLQDTETPNVVTAVLADYRSHDTLGETVVIFTAAIAAVVVLRRRQDQGASSSASGRRQDQGASSSASGRRKNETEP
jgi:multicomponent Na+:H+ antiporter subunit B